MESSLSCYADSHLSPCLSHLQKHCRLSFTPLHNPSSASVSHPAAPAPRFTSASDPRGCKRAPDSRDCFLNATYKAGAIAERRTASNTLMYILLKKGSFHIYSKKIYYHNFPFRSCFSCCISH